jgi:hypothetical protein
MFKYVYFFRRYLSNKQIKTFVLKKFQIWILKHDVTQ